MLIDMAFEKNRKNEIVNTIETCLPTYDHMMLPILKYLRDDKDHSKHDVTDYIKKYYNLTDEGLSKTLQGGQTIIDNRISWAITYLKKAVLLEYPQRSIYRITTRGVKFLKENPELVRIDRKVLSQFPEFIPFKTWNKKKSSTSPVESKELPDKPAIELIEEGIQVEKLVLIDDIIQSLKNVSPARFEWICLDVLERLGYGKGEVVGRSGDGGIDIRLKKDVFGLETNLAQCKRWENTVGEPEISHFAGSLLGCKARSGIIITTSSFTKPAIEYISKIDRVVILIDGQHLAQLMIDKNIGVSEESTYIVKKIDNNYFME
jgi:restriction system protein